MAHHQDVYLRLTHKYVGTFKDLDDHAYIGEVKVLGRRKVNQPEAYYEEPSHGPVYVMRVIVPKTWNRKIWTQALHDAFSRHGCAHEYDCCGCANYSADVRFVGKREAVVRTVITYNF